MLTATNIKGSYLEYKGKPLVRHGDELYYGDMRDKFCLFLLVMSYAKDEKLSIEIPDAILVSIVSTQNTDKVEKQKVVHGFYEAFDLGCAWLDRANKAQ